MTRPETPPRPRYELIDMVRGAAIVGMIVYHLGWDLGYLGFITTDVTVDTAWVAFQRLLLGSFLFLVGTSLVLAHRKAIRWGAFWRRFAVVAGAALAITVSTYLLFPQTFVFFGVLHAIALFSLLALPFLRAPSWLTAITGAAFIALPAWYRSPQFNDKLLAWIGPWTEAPPTNDLVPIFPWFGVVLFGIAVTRLLRGSKAWDRLAAVHARGPIPRLLALAGRWSLWIYLVHQPLLLAVLYPLAMQVQPGTAAQAQEFLASCQSSCMQVQGDVAMCQAYCACGLDLVETDNLWGSLYGTQPSAEQQDAVAAITRQCSPPAN